MEFLLILLLVGVVIVFLLKRRSQEKQAPPPSRPAASRPVAPKVVPFDAKTAAPRPDHPILEGSAYVVDGDTVVIQKTQVRLFGVDAPEIDHPYGKKAKWALVSGGTVNPEPMTRRGQIALFPIDDPTGSPPNL